MPAVSSPSSGKTAELKRMKLSDLKSARYNPKTRTEKVRLNKIIRSIEQIGLIYPVAVTKDGQIIDGHRRVAAAKALQWEEIPVLVVAGDPEEVYGSVNSATRRITGTEKLLIWLQEPRAIDDNEKHLFMRAEKDLGRPLLTRIAKTGGSITTYRWAREVGSYVDEKTPEFYRKACEWIIQYRSAKLVRSLMALKQPSSTIRKAVLSGRPITASYSVVK